jgi:hypothetical protein
VQPTGGICPDLQAFFYASGFFLLLSRIHVRPPAANANRYAVDTEQNKRSETRRKLVVTEFELLDGVIHNPMWTVPYWNDETAQF